VPADIFRITDIEVVISPHGDLVSQHPHRGPYQGVPWQSIEFEEAEIKQQFPSPPKQSVQEWMLQEAERYRSEGKIGKRDIMVKDCMNETHCTRKVAQAAHKLLPEEFKRKPGKPPKHAG
jgi:hypothetical protein